MELTIPEALRTEHSELHRELAAAARAPGRVGEAARAVAALFHPHFVDEEAFALPPLALLAPLARGERISEVATVLRVVAKLKAELPRMLSEHKAICTAVQELAAAAQEAGDSDSLRLAEKIIAHATMEEQILYPAAILVGEYLNVVT